MASINLDDLNYVINNFDTSVNFDLSLNDITSTTIICNNLNVSNNNGDFYNSINDIFQKYIEDLSSIDASINTINNSLDSLNNIDNSFTQISNSITQLESSYNDLSNSLLQYPEKSYIDSSFDNINSNINNILKQDTSFNGKITFNNDVSLNKILYISTIDPAPDNNSGTVIIKGNLQIDGSNTTINSSEFYGNNIQSIILAKNSNSLLQVNEAGIVIGNTSGPSILYKNIDEDWNINTNLDISGKLIIEDNDFSFKINDNNDNKKVEILMSQNDELYIEGDLTLGGNIINKYINNDHNSTITLINTRDISNNMIYSHYDGSNTIISNNNVSFDNYFNTNKGYYNNGYNIYFTDCSYEDIYNQFFTNGISNVLYKMYNILKLDNVNDFSYITPNDNTNFYEVSNNKIVLKNDSNEKIDLNIKLNINRTVTKNFYIDTVIFKYNDVSYNEPNYIIDSSQINISNSDLSMNLNINLSIDSIHLNKNECIGFGFLIYTYDISGILNGINDSSLNHNTMNDISFNFENINFYSEKNSIRNLLDISVNNISDISNTIVSTDISVNDISINNTVNSNSLTVINDNSFAKVILRNIYGYSQTPTNIPVGTIYYNTNEDNRLYIKYN